MADEVQFVLEIGGGGGAGCPDMLPLQPDGTDHVQLGKDRPGQGGPQREDRHFKFAVLIVRGQQEEGLGQVKLYGSGCLGVHMTMVLPGRGLPQWPQTGSVRRV